MGMEVDVIEVRDHDDLERQAETMKRKKTDAIWFFTSVFRTGDPSVVKVAVRHRDDP
jgi:hypothetical protein